MLEHIRPEQLEPFVLNQAKLQDLELWLKEHYGRPCFSLVADLSRPITPTTSRIGGIPYWDFTGAESFPQVEGKALRFLCQINLEQLAAENPVVRGQNLPCHGLLQFFVGEDESFGCTYEPDNPACKVVYIPKLDPADAGLTMEGLRQRLIAHGCLTQAGVQTQSHAPNYSQVQSQSQSLSQSLAQSQSHSHTPNQGQALTQSPQINSSSQADKCEATREEKLEDAKGEAVYDSSVASGAVESGAIGFENVESGGAEYWPIHGECALKLVAGVDLPHAGDDAFDFNQFFAEMQRTGAITLSRREMWGSALYCKLVQDPDFARIVDKLLQCGADKKLRLGSLLGYPDFVQYSPLSWSDLGERFDTLLLRLEDLDASPNFEMLWCDCGIADFFMNSKALAQCDFCDIFYYWDCG